jgi:methyl-accepting chemotaxis protein
MRKFSDIPILGKIAVGGAILAVVTVVVIVQMVGVLETVRDSAGNAVAQQARRLLLANNAFIYFDNITTSDRDQVFARNDDDRAAAEKSYSSDIASGYQALDQLQALLATAQDRADIDKARSLIRTFERLEKQAFELARQGHRDEAYGIILGDAAKAYNDGTALLDTQVKAAQQEMDRQKAVIDDQVARAQRMAALIAIPGLLGGMVAMAWIVIGHVTRPLKGVQDLMAKLAEGNLSVAVVGAERQDEVGQMVRTVEVFKQNAIERQRLEQQERDAAVHREKRTQALEGLTRDFDGAVAGVLGTVTQATGDLEGTAQAMAASADQTTRQAGLVAASSEETSVSVETVATAAEELSASIVEIGRQVDQSSLVSQAASEEAARTDATVKGLAESSTRIGAVVSLINDIASQTNLLALNATIEAARAGDAGKGFAVVANEVKSLANQTAKATGDISEQISAVQAATRDAVTAIGAIVGRISQLKEISGAIASAVTEQGAATAEIARNVQQAAAGTREISSNIGSVTRAAAETGTAAGQVLSSARTLSHEAVDLKGIVDRFLAGVTGL